MDTVVIIAVHQSHPGPTEVFQDLDNGTHLEGVTGDCSEKGGELMPVSETGTSGIVAYLIESERKKKQNKG